MAYGKNVLGEGALREDADREFSFSALQTLAGKDCWLHVPGD